MRRYLIWQVYLDEVALDAGGGKSVARAKVPSLAVSQRIENYRQWRSKFRVRCSLKRSQAVKKIGEMIGRKLEWVQPSAWKMQYELRAGDELIATLRFRSSFGSFATAESADGCWTFKRVGFWQT